jgi:hypothetical protein
MCLTGGYHEDIYCSGLELTANLVGVDRADVRVGDQGIAMRRSGAPDEVADPAEDPSLDGDGRRAEPYFLAGYQVTSPAPVRTLATRASVKSRSDSRFR